ncbi:hypothetical protein QNI16_34260 [Cytophagaceae bacterium YF14B1]|uniref:HlyD family secretion protein n=1 Tax=Xanthocytophaga flava TaxID=3048013 RepID=A0AAE3QYP8_9BACT|nr:hypothetical protein [Xanthocytophaga flavus]MDJ1485605.1 hypothetical protein [Xanthocytophaga flavus]
MPHFDTKTVYSEELYEIIGYIPRWITRWGITVIACVFILFLILTSIIQFPESITAKMIITPKEPPFAVSWYQTDIHVSYELKAFQYQQVKVGDTLLLEKDEKAGKVSAITTPVTGKVHLSVGREKNTKAKLLAVVPQNTQFEGLLLLSEQGMGKVEAGQNVLIRLDAYPESEFGLLKGQIKQIFPVQFDKKFRVTVALPGKLVTTTGKRIPTQAQMEGSAEIITDNQKLIRRIFANIW